MSSYKSRVFIQIIPKSAWHSASEIVFTVSYDKVHFLQINPNWVAKNYIKWMKISIEIAGKNGFLGWWCKPQIPPLLEYYAPMLNIVHS